MKLFKVLGKIFILYTLAGCQPSDSEKNSRLLTYEVKSLDTIGNAGDHSRAIIYKHGNPLGYYEYLPLSFTEESNKLSLVFYWNGQNSMAGNGSSDLDRLLSQGLSLYIHGGYHYNAIIISAMMPYKAWKHLDIDPFVNFILKKYSRFIDIDKVYMTGFSAGGALTVRYASEHPEKLAAIWPISAAVKLPNENQPSEAMKKVPSWFYHNIGDTVVTFDRSVQWQKKLSSKGYDHKITLLDSDTHYAWQAAYKNNDTWKWLLSKSKADR
jgi:predicted peptidase